MGILTFEEVMKQDNAIRFKWDVIKVETSPFVVVIDEGYSKVNDLIIQFADNVMSARKECEEHIVPIKLYKSWYDRGMSVRYSGYCIKCGAYCECHNDEVRVGDGVKMEIANNVVFPDLQKLEENYMGHSFSLSYEDYEKRFNLVAKQFTNTKTQEVVKNH